MLENSAYLSLFIQFITGIIDVLGLSIAIPSDKTIFNDLLQVELSVQTVEFIFYVWMILNLSTIKNITPYRYFDWFITTPIMLVTFIAYLEDKPYTNLFEFIVANVPILFEIIFLNMLMLLFGFLGEIKCIPYLAGILFGFVPFVYYFKRIYDNYINENTSKDKVNLYWFFLIIWTFYGIAALMPYTLKNTLYNLLDLFSKNGFGLFLVYVLWTYRIKT